MDAQAGARDHAEGALAAHEQLGEVGPDRGARRAAGVHHPTVGEGDVEAQHHVLDLPVAGRQLARAAARQPAADGGEVDRLGPVAEGDVVIAAQRGLQGSPERTGPDIEHERGVVDVHDPGERGEVEDDAAVHRHARAAHPAAAGGRGDGYPCLVADAQHRGDAVGGGRPHHRGRRGHLRAVALPDHRQRPPVAADRSYLVGRGLQRAQGRQPVEHRRRDLGDGAAERAHAGANGRSLLAGIPGSLTLTP